MATFMIQQKRGHTLYKVAYETALQPLVHVLKVEIPNITQPWYANDALAGGSVAGI
jgi:hypothetical protein